MSSFKGRGFVQMTGKQRRNMATISGMSNGNYGATLSPSYTAQSHVTLQGASGTVNFGNTLQTISLDTISSLLNSSYIRKYEIYETNEDLLIPSCVWYRHRKNKTTPNSGGISGMAGITIQPSKLSDSILFENITPEDRELAAKIRDYYSKKIMMLKLKDIKLTSYRQDLNDFIHSDGTKFQEKMFGLVYRLPEFYEYDMKFESLIVDCDKEIRNKKDPRMSQQKLQYLGKLNIDRKTSKRVEYWFKNEEGNVANISIDPHNPLMNVWEHIAKNNPTLEGNYYIKYRDTIEYFHIKNYSIV